MRTTERVAPREGALGVQVASGLRWNLVDTGVQQLLRFVITIMLTRLVAPRDFGVLGMALVFTQLAALIGDLGLGPAIVQRKEITSGHVTTAFSISVLVGAGLTLLLIALSWPISWLFDEPRVQPVLMWLSVSYLLRGAGAVPRELLRREMRFRSIAIVSLASVTTSGAVAVAFALSGAGVWSLVALVITEGVAGTITAGIVATLSKLWKPAWGVDRRALQDLGRFGAFVSGARIAFYGASYIDNLIVGKAFGASALGFYNLAYRIMLFPILKVADVVATVTMPALSSIQDDVKRVSNAYRRAVTYIGVVCFPVSAGTAIAAPVLVPFVFGAKWSGAIGVVQILSLNGVRLAVGRLSGTVYEALGRPVLDFVMMSVTFVAYLVAFLIGVNWGIEGVAWGYTIAGYLLLPLDQTLVNRCLNTRPSQLFAGLVPVAAATAAVAAVAGMCMARVPSSAGVNTRAGIVLTASIVTYAIALHLASPALLREMLRSIARR